MIELLSAAQNAADSTGAGIFTGFFSVLMLFYCVLAIVGLAFTVIWLWMLVDAVSRGNYDGPNDKLLWALVILFGGIIGAAIYYFVIKSKK